MNLKKYNGQEIVWFNVVIILLFHILGCFFLSTCSETNWKTIAYAAILGQFIGLGIGAGAHRLWSHRSYKAKLPFRLLLLILFTMSGHMSVYDWVRNHRTHHRFSETDADPHNSKRGFFFSHIGWLMLKKRPEVAEKGRTIDMSDIESDPLLAFQRKYYEVLRLVFMLALPTCVPPLFWGETWRNSFITIIFMHVVNLNINASVNSFAHFYGARPYDVREGGVEIETLGWITLGEGWHNYHHAFPWDYRARELGPGLTGLTTKLIRLGERLGLCYDLRAPSDELVKLTALRHGDGSWPEVSETDQQKLK